MASYALDAIDDYAGDKPDTLTPEDAGRFVKGLGACRVSTFPSVGLGTDCRMDSGEANGLALVVENRVVHLSAFARAGRSGEEKPRARLSRSSTRQRRLF